MTSENKQESTGFRSEVVAVVTASAAVWRLISLRERYALCGATVVMALSAWFNARIPFVLGDLASAMGRFKATGETWKFANALPFLLLLALYFVIREALHVVRKYLVHNTCTRVEKQVTVNLVSHLLKSDLGVMSRDRVGALHGRIRRSVEGYVRLLMLGFMDFLPAVLTAAFAIGVAIHRQPFLGSVMCGVVPLAIVIVFWQIGSQKGIRLALLRSKESVDGAIVEQLNGIEYVRAANTHEYELARVEQVCEGVREKEIKHHVSMSLFDFAKAFNEGVFFILVVALAIGRAATGSIEIGDVITYALLFSSFLAPLRDVHRILDEAHESTLRVGDLLGLLAEPRDRSFNVPNPQVPNLESNVPVFEVSGLGFEYATADGSRKVGLRHVGFSISRGEKVGVAGPSGCGKSTLLRVLLRLKHPSEGDVRFGGVTVESISREALAKAVGYVSQTPFLFTGTVRENIAYECRDASFQAIRRAAEMAGIHDEIMLMPAGYDAAVLERGQNLSGGQQQRIALARVFLKNPPVIILDEGTSALDTISERHVQNTLAEMGGDRTLIIVAHRLSSLRETDRILVLDRGELVEDGDFETLAGAGGVFAKMVQSAADFNGGRPISLGAFAAGMGCRMSVPGPTF